MGNVKAVMESAIKILVIVLAGNVPKAGWEINVLHTAIKADNLYSIHLSVAYIKSSDHYVHPLCLFRIFIGWTDRPK